jgi:hypothetical protein
MWPVDHVSRAPVGISSLVGQSCDLRLQAMAIWDGAPLPGTRVTMMASGPVRTTGVCLVGSERQPPRDLGTNGSMRCQVFVDPFDALPYTFPPQKLEQLTRVEHPLAVPAQPCFFGARFLIQWLQMPNAGSPAALAATHAQATRLGDALPAGSMTTVRSLPSVGPFPDAGEVQPQHAPVLRFEAR